VLPVATLLLASLAAGIRMVRAGMVETLQAEYVMAARLNGLSERWVLWRYAMRNALAPSVQVLAQNLQWLIGGIIITETVFAYPGLGSLLVTAVGNRDLGVVQSVAMLIAVVYVMLNLVADLIVLLLVPKLREPA
jgi:peptide/nickel transport system permease protein